MPKPKNPELTGLDRLTQLQKDKLKAKKGK
jgi:hypothetical protein